MRLRVAKGEYIEAKESRFVLHTHGSLEDSSGGQVVRVEDIINKIRTLEGYEGITICGGEPMDQSDVLLSIAKEVRIKGMNVWTYSNYTLEEIITIGAKFETNSYQRMIIMSDMLVCNDDKINGGAIDNKQYFDTDKTLETMSVVLLDNF